MLCATKETFIGMLSGELWEKNSQYPLLDLKYKQDYRVVVTAMTLSKWLGINYLGMETIRIYFIYILLYITFN